LHINHTVIKKCKYEGNVVGIKSESQLIGYSILESSNIDN